MHYDMDELLIDEEHGKTVSRLEEIKLNIQKSMIHKSEIEHILMMINSMWASIGITSIKVHLIQAIIDDRLDKKSVRRLSGRTFTCHNRVPSRKHFSIYTVILRSLIGTVHPLSTVIQSICFQKFQPSITVIFNILCQTMLSMITSSSTMSKSLLSLSINQ